MMTDDTTNCDVTCKAAKESDVRIKDAFHLLYPHVPLEVRLWPMVLRCILGDCFVGYNFFKQIWIPDKYV